MLRFWRNSITWAAFAMVTPGVIVGSVNGGERARPTQGRR